eukprot:CAMPEP_0169168182 /NCGR_PEP_ID=MMETSP1015-20121227/60866_1 /TAXON_ID=342587 /ORGANISM="Karlodinium micrum, Strain CCMP2283" /LENGTH=152 /DNA_ID=CAMNT_0009240937 /DNA_START=201 /DNA_END=656 /DNA_ORIENTATION=+
MALVGNIPAILLSVFLTSHVHCSQEHISVNSGAQLAAIKQHDNSARRALIRRGDDESKEEAIDQAGGAGGTATANATSLPPGWYCPQGVVSGSRGTLAVVVHSFGVVMMRVKRRPLTKPEPKLAQLTKLLLPTRVHCHMGGIVHKEWFQAAE